jgi:hypothetical protein
MFSEQEVQIASVVVALQGLAGPGKRTGSLVPDQDIPDYAAAKAGSPGPQAKIRFLVNQKKPLVDQTDAAENFRPHHHAAAVDNVYVGDGGHRGRDEWHWLALEETRLSRVVE